MFGKETGYRYEREINSFYAGKVRHVRCGFHEPLPVGRRIGGNGSIRLFQVGFPVCGCAGSPCLCIFQDVFQELHKAVCGKSGVSQAHFQNKDVLGIPKEPDGTEEDAPYLPVSGLPPKDTHSPREGEDYGEMPKMRQGI